MVITQSRSKRTVGGARYHDYRKKKLYDKGSEPTHTKIGKTQLKRVKGKAAIQKIKVVVAETANVLDPKTKQFKQAKIVTVKENPASQHFVRRNIITKGAVIETEIGKARVTSRPGQDGTINAVLIS